MAAELITEMLKLAIALPDLFPRSISRVDMTQTEEFRSPLFLGD